MMDLPKALNLALGGTNEVQYVSSRGNAGDFLIAEATRQTLDKIGVKVSSGAETILVSGGGNMHPSYSCMVKSISRIPRDKRVIILPSTIVGSFPLLAGFQNLLLMARDELTSKLARLSQIRTMNVHDAAFSFDYAEWMDVEPNGKLAAFRTDTESVGRHIRLVGNRDISAAFGSGRCLLNHSEMNARKFVGEIAKYEKIDTDRCHVAIVGAMLGKRVRLWSGNYHKNRSIYESSLRRFDQVTFEE